MKTKGLHCERTKTNPTEKAFADAWETENEHSFVLEYILSTNNRRIDVSDRDRIVAATMAQWLGTNCGLYFIERAIGSSPELREKLEYMLAKHQPRKRVRNE